ncbi:hypothetical protein Slala03_69780 [Streptomyces lavendulae subsp. lavendulae]|nr:hypothetical protein Slala03_69780 [Streptomyces lavendulae subsp. lavendulae]
MIYGTLDGLTPQGTLVRRSALPHRTDVTGLVGVIASITAHEVTRGRIPSGLHVMAATLPPRATADWIVRHLPRTTARTTEVPTGGPDRMTPTSPPVSGTRDEAVGRQRGPAANARSAPGTSNRKTEG